MRWLLAAVMLSGCATLGPTDAQLKALAKDGSCLGWVGQINAQLYGSGGGGMARLNSPGMISVAKDGTITCEIK
jgi:hypothetical protein